jgi:hypothetical protein
VKRQEKVTTEAVMSALHHADWSLGEWGIDGEHVTEAHWGGHRIIVAARATTIAWLALWAKLKGRGGLLRPIRRAGRPRHPLCDGAE